MSSGLKIYGLIGQTVVDLGEPDWKNDPVGTLAKMRMFEDRDYRRVAETWYFDLVRVSTVFLCYDQRGYSHGRRGDPILFETMAFWAGEGGYDQEQCATWIEAEAQHRAMCAEVQRPRAVWDYFGRTIRQFFSDARSDARSEWRRFLGQWDEDDESLSRMKSGRERLL